MLRVKKIILNKLIYIEDDYQVMNIEKMITFKMHTRQGPIFIK